MVKLRTQIIVFLLGVASAGLLADDGAASIAAGGVILLTRQPQVVMAKETLELSSSKVIVDYDFRNESDRDIATLVAFPIPDYSLAMEDATPSSQGFDDFRLWIKGAPASFKIEARAYLKGKDYSALLRRLQIDISSFGHATDNDSSPEIAKLTVTQHAQLVRAGLIDKDSDGPLWTVRKKYYWEQTFPAYGVVHIRHEYTPVLGSSNSVRYGLGAGADPAMAAELKSLCLDQRLQRSLQQNAESPNREVPYWYVDFILTSANTWKTPIEDFTLIVDRDHLKGSLADYVSFCWVGPVEKLSADKFSARSRNLIPKKELRVGFISVFPGKN